MIKDQDQCLFSLSPIDKSWTFVAQFDLVFVHLNYEKVYMSADLCRVLQILQALGQL